MGIMREGTREATGRAILAGVGLHHAIERVGIGIKKIGIGKAHSYQYKKHPTDDDMSRRLLHTVNDCSRCRSHLSFLPSHGSGNRACPNFPWPCSANPAGWYPSAFLPPAGRRMKAHTTA